MNYEEIIVDVLVDNKRGTESAEKRVKKWSGVVPLSDPNFDGGQMSVFNKEAPTAYADYALYGAVIDAYMSTPRRTFEPATAAQQLGNDLGPNEWVVHLVASSPLVIDYHWTRQDFNADGTLKGWVQQQGYQGNIYENGDISPLYSLSVGYYVVSR